MVRGAFATLAALAFCSALGCSDASTRSERTPTWTVSVQLAVEPALSVMSVNARIPGDSGERSWAARLPRLIGMIQRHQPHAIAFQELERKNGHDTLADLSARLPEYWRYGVDRGDGEIIALFMRRDRLTPLEFSFRNVSNSERDNSCSWTADEDPRNRPIQYVLARDVATNRERYFYNTHYPSRNSCERHGMATIVASYINGRGNASLPVVLLGDLNDGVEPDGRLNGSFERLLNATGLISAYFATDPRNSSSAFKTENGPFDTIARTGRMIDHVLVTPWDTAVTSSAVDRTLFTSPGNAPVACDVVSSGTCPDGSPASGLALYSDHWAVWARIGAL